MKTATIAAADFADLKTTGAGFAFIRDNNDGTFLTVSAASGAMVLWTVR